MACGKGFVLGGAAGTGAFLITLRLARLKNKDSKVVYLFAGAWLAVRMCLYARVLTYAYYFEAARLHGFFGAAAGLVMVQIVVMVLGYTGWDQQKVT